MKIFLILIYATLMLYANTSFSHERKDLETIKKHLRGSLKNILLNEEPTQVPSMDLVTLNNTSKPINFQQNKITLINFWATWCAPCREEMPSLNKLVKSVGSKDFSVIVVAAGRNSDDTIKDFFSKHDLINLKSYKDPKGKVSSNMNVLGLPTTIIVDQHSNELARLFGSTDWNSQEAIKFINTLLAHTHLP
ncbi:MAG: redoxin domain-containing protein [Paracoccaceae bacterium]|nr:redoxin domain-containing protein [Paracoccaceae bacterium]